ncbi:class I SAM-dependent methyltransferase [Massilia sp. Dwa41.01b]|uniref:class I SAM-dependent methyltransferase n=1 Tax=unclassified Massilia TaxID=2609279 RepID=UPI0016012BC3|nr:MULTISPECIES: SAM-dependent methyltransferase [unclassified Massilia]QNA90726.1 class I SAM-dependent methyltransferase [Massilia sp. Dwa41.01b]QNA97961.1 class I SAM-dependent methyltransferase [Massilia sp. Se16.2.3]
MSLPLPDSDALAASHALQQQIAAAIEAAGGAIPFSRFMELALYAPRLGYYSGGAAKLGAPGDFTTAPEITPLFGESVARAAAAIIAQSAPNIIEFGAGTGKLARDVLTALAADGVQVASYTIIELSGELRVRQQEALRDFPQVNWRDGFPEGFSGVVLANEVLDAMPIELVVKTEDGWRRQMVTIAEGRFTYEQAELDADLGAQLLRQVPDAGSLPVGYLTEIHPVACGFMASLAAMFKGGKGAAFLFDYGFPAHEFYVDQRSGGTLMCHYRHHSHPEPFFLPGLQDITAHVDFTAMALAAQDAGLEVLAYMNQASFLLACGIGELLLRVDPEDVVRYLPQSKAVQKLVSPSEMGELFKVLVVGNGVDLPDEFVRADRSTRL